MPVHYVAPPKTEKGKISINKEAKIIEVRGEDLALLQLDDKGDHLAEAAYSSDPAVENTFHFADESAPASNGAAPK
jgi:hypothetical protein